MIALLLATAAALAGPAKTLDVKVIGPGDAVIIEDSVTLPHEEMTAEVELGGLPFVITVIINERHDTVAVEAAVVELRGKKAKPVEVGRPRLVLYQDFEGRVEMKTDTPKKFVGADGDTLSWVIEADWTVAKAEEPTPAPAPAAEPAPTEPDAAAPPDAPDTTNPAMDAPPDAPTNPAPPTPPSAPSGPQGG